MLNGTNVPQTSLGPHDDLEGVGITGKGTWKQK